MARRRDRKTAQRVERHLYRRFDTLVYRRALPQALQEASGVREFQRALDTADSWASYVSTYIVALEGATLRGRGHRRPRRHPTMKLIETAEDVLAELLARADHEPERFIALLPNQLVHDRFYPTKEMLGVELTGACVGLRQAIAGGKLTLRDTICAITGALLHARFTIALDTTPPLFGFRRPFDDSCVGAVLTIIGGAVRRRAGLQLRPSARRMRALGVLLLAATRPAVNAIYQSYLAEHRQRHGLDRLPLGLLVGPSRRPLDPTDAT